MSKRIIVFAPHPDDETFGCGGTIAKKINDGYDVLVVIMTDGRYAFEKVLGISSDPSPDELKEIRKDEVIRAMKILGVPTENIIFLNFEDGKLNDFKKEAEKKVIRILAENHPEEVYFPYKKDAHPDHKATYYIVKNAIRKLGIHVAEYQYSIGTKFSRIGPILDHFLAIFRRNIHRVDISKYLSKKKEAIEQFKSELNLISREQTCPLINNIKKYLREEEIFYTK